MRAISIPVLHPRGGFLSEMVSFVADGLRDLGFNAFLVEDGAEKLLEADLVLLFGDLLRLRPTLELLSETDARPSVAAWQMDPLPSPHLTSSDLLKGVDAAARRDTLRTQMDGRTGRAIRRLAGTPPARKLRAVLHGGSAETQQEDLRHLVCFDRLSVLRKYADGGVFDTIAVSSPERVDVLATVGVRAEFVPMGFHPSMGENLGGRRDIEAIFLGSVSDRRKRILQQVQAQLREQGMQLAVEKGFFGATRTRLLNGVKTVLGPHRSDEFWEFSRTRLIVALACGALPVCEAGPDTAPFEPGVHFVSAPSHELADAVVHHSHDESVRNSLVSAGTAFVTNELTMHKSLRALHPDLATATSSSAAGSGAGN